MRSVCRIKALIILCTALAASLAVANILYTMRWEKAIFSKTWRSLSKAGTERQKIDQEENGGPLGPTMAVVPDKTNLAKQENEGDGVGFDRDINEQNDAGHDETIRTNTIRGTDGNGDDIYRDSAGRVKLSKQLEIELIHRLATATEKKIILVWHSEFGDKFPVDFDLKRCGSCELTYDRSKITDPHTGAVVFHYNALIDHPTDMPKTRNPDQLWIYWVLESSYTLKLKQKNPLTFEDSIQFNATLTYRLDSDFYMSYEKDSGNVETLAEQNKHAYGEILKSKTKLGIAVVSNCGIANTAAWVRYTKLRELTEIDKGFEGYGGCFEKRRISGSWRGEQFRRKVREYKFYFAMENSFHCKDYITEKFFHNALKSLSVPVVWGPSKEDYLAVVPAGSFVHADDFPSTKKLVEYLKYLDKNDTAYMEYFKWLTMKPEEMPQYGRARSWCHICRGLHGINIDDVYNPNFNMKNLKRPLFTDGIAKRTVPSLSKWFYGEDNPECFYDWMPVIMNRSTTLE